MNKVLVPGMVESPLSSDVVERVFPTRLRLKDTSAFRQISTLIIPLAYLQKAIATSQKGISRDLPKTTAIVCDRA